MYFTPEGVYNPGPCEEKSLGLSTASIAGGYAAFGNTYALLVWLFRWQRSEASFTGGIRPHSYFSFGAECLP